MVDINILGHEQNCRHFAADIFKCIFENKEMLSPCQYDFDLFFMLLGDKPLSEPMLPLYADNITIAKFIKIIH